MLLSWIFIIFNMLSCRLLKIYQVSKLVFKPLVAVLGRRRPAMWRQKRPTRLCIQPAVFLPWNREWDHQRFRNQYFLPFQFIFLISDSEIINGNWSIMEFRSSSESRSWQLFLIEKKNIRQNIYWFEPVIYTRYNFQPRPRFRPGFRPGFPGSTSQDLQVYHLSIISYWISLSKVLKYFWNNIYGQNV